jgi:DNA-binding GntR family transcriptional regulator
MMTQLLRPPTLGRVVIDKIRETILRGELLPGAPLREVQLSNSLGVSRGTIRESVRQLREEGLVEIFPHRGAFVTHLSHKKAKEICTLRALLEPYAVRLAVEKGAYEPQVLDRLEALLSRWGELEREGNIHEILNTEIEFHRGICQGSGHQLLLEVLENLVSQSQLLALHTKVYGTDLVSDDASHRAILDAIRSGDPTVAEEAVRRHILDAGELLIGRLEQLETVDAQFSGADISPSDLQVCESQVSNA